MLCPSTGDAFMVPPDLSDTASVHRGHHECTRTQPWCTEAVFEYGRQERSRQEKSGGTEACMQTLEQLWLSLERGKDFHYYTVPKPANMNAPAPRLCLSTGGKRGQERSGWHLASRPPRASFIISFSF